MKKHNYFSLLCFFSFFLFSCPLITKDKQNEKKEPDYDYYEVWSLPIDSNYIYTRHTQENKYLYVFEGKRKLDDENIVNVTKIDLSSGEKIWTCYTGKERPYSEIGFWGRFVFFQSDDDQIVFIDKESGILKKIIDIGKNACLNEKVFVKNDYLYWGNSGVVNCILRIDLDEIDFQDSNTEQFIQPEYIAPNKRNNKPSSVWFDNTVVYYLTFNPSLWNEEESCELVAYDLETDTYMFMKDMPDESGSCDCSVQVIGEKLYVIGGGISCFNKFTGDTYWQKYQTYEDCQSEVFIYPYMNLKDMVVYNNTFLFTGQAGQTSYIDSGIPKENFKNMYCISAEDGSFLWGELVPGSGSLNVNPIIYENKCYLVANTCLRVYDVTNGTLLGTHGNLYTSGRNFAYNDLLIFTNYPYDEMTNGEYYGVLTAIRMK